MYTKYYSSFFDNRCNDGDIDCRKIEKLAEHANTPDGKPTSTGIYVLTRILTNTLPPGSDPLVLAIKCGAPIEIIDIIIGAEPSKQLHNVDAMYEALSHSRLDIVERFISRSICLNPGPGHELKPFCNVKHPSMLLDRSIMSFDLLKKMMDAGMSMYPITSNFYLKFTMMKNMMAKSSKRPVSEMLKILDYFSDELDPILINNICLGMFNDDLTFDTEIVESFAKVLGSPELYLDYILRPFAKCMYVSQSSGDMCNSIISAIGKLHRQPTLEEYALCVSMVTIKLSLMAKTSEGETPGASKIIKGIVDHAATMTSLTKQMIGSNRGHSASLVDEFLSGWKDVRGVD